MTVSLFFLHFTDTGFGALIYYTGLLLLHGKEEEEEEEVEADE